MLGKIAKGEQMKLEHVAFNLQDPKAAAAWYAEHLGMRIIRAMGDETQVHFLVDSGDQTVIEFYRNTQSTIPDYASLGPYSLHVAFTVDDIDVERERLVAAGAAVEGETVIMPSGDKLAFLRDPWGLVVQLVERREPLR
jgi:catechol 2,3-dioxygenase-like lactoylglutathione lyase family enzyme